MIYRFIFEGNTPSKKTSQEVRFNSKTKRRFITTSEDFKIWHREATLVMHLQMSKYIQRFPIQRCKRVMAMLYYGDRRPRDTNNTWHSITDLLKDVRIITDDNWLVLGDEHKFPRLRQGRPGWEVQLETEDP